MIFFKLKKKNRKFEMDSKSYNNISNCNQCENVDELMKKYIQQKEQSIKLLYKNPDHFVKNAWKANGTLLLDNECQCNVGNHLPKTPFSCYNCRNLRRLVDFRSQSVYQPFQIECGENEGLTLVLDQYDIGVPKLGWDMETVEYARNYYQRHQGLRLCGGDYDLQSMRNLRCDPFTSKILVSWLVEKTLQKDNLPHYLLNYTSFICGKHGYTLTEYPSLGGWKKFLSNKDSMKNNELNPKYVRDFLIQLLCILTSLENIKFSHGSSNFKAFLFKKSPCQYQFAGLTVNAPFTLLLHHFLYSSALMGNVHISSTDLKTELYLQRTSFTPEIQIKNIKPSYCEENQVLEDIEIICPSTVTLCPNDEVTKNICKVASGNASYYKLTNDTLNIYMNMRHIGFPLFTGSFDFYSFLVSCMCCKKFFDCVYADEKLHRLWSMMWSTEDLISVEDALRPNHEIDMDVLPDQISTEILRGKWLRCNIVPYMIDLIKSGW